MTIGIILFSPGRNSEQIERPPAMHSAMDWCKYGYIYHMVKLALHRFLGIAGRSNIERPILMALRFIHFKAISAYDELG
jgi:hypothetical protein